MATFELDMGFIVDELVRGLETLLRKRASEWKRLDEPPDRTTFQVHLDDGVASITVCPMPPERVAPLTFPPRSLLTVSSDAPAEAVERLRKEILFAFLRVAG